MNIYLAIILTILIGEYFLKLFVERLNIRNASPILPEEFKGHYDAERYRKSQNYLIDNTKFALFKGAVFTALTIFFILFDGFNFVDLIARKLNLGSVPTGLIFAGILLIAYELLTVPFAAYRTFVIEEKYGFNKTGLKTFVLDIIKGLLLSCIIGGAIFAGVIWFFESKGGCAWIYSWIAVTIVELFLTFIAPILILPIFNKFIPLEEGELKDSIEGYAKSQNFKIKSIFKMDASRRTSKSNAFFTGFGKSRKVALFDNLIEKHTVDELVSVLAHEIGHYKKRHIIKHLALSIITQGFMFFVLSLFINNRGLFDAFKMDGLSVYASLVFFGFLYSPISLIFSVTANIFSRKCEYEADLFVAKTYKMPEAFITALKKLTVDNLSNLTPHHMKVILSYSHPPILERIKTFRSRIVY